MDRDRDRSASFCEIVGEDMSAITFVRQGPFLLLQFNMSCAEALPVCQAMCCRMRRWYNVHLTSEEIEHGGYETQTWESGKVVLKQTPEGDCIYLKDSKCSIYSRRPKDCVAWHCSPGGNPGDESITKRAQGWIMVPGTEAMLES